jgi:serine/threonine protein phosphatase PrpC
MMSKKTSASQPQPMEATNKSRGWVRPRPADDSQLSQSLGTGLLSRTTSMKRSTSEIGSISYRGYLLKRSNFPHQDSYQHLSSLPLDAALDTKKGYVLEPQFQVFAKVIMNGDGVTTATEEPVHVPQHLTVSKDGLSTENETESETTEDETDKSLLEHSIQNIASFFGMNPHETTTKPVVQEEKKATEPEVESQTRQSSAAATSPLSVRHPSTPPQPILAGTRSAPISVTSNLQSQMPAMPFDDDVLRFLHRGDSAPSVMGKISQAASVDTALPPADYVDPKDGHIWRAKYCVLEDGILYFYRNAQDGECQEAKYERAKSLQMYESTPNDAPEDGEDLSKSPTPRKLLNSMAKQVASGVIYENRVFLDRVGAVRSTEHEYGDCSFELLAVQDDDEQVGGGMDMMAPFASDKLVLRTRNADEMREWLFQFHRYLATLMKNIIERSVGLTVPVVGDIHHPSFAFPPHELGLKAVNKYCPKSMVQSSGFHFPPSLSHGHGQSSALRRKRTGRTPSSTPSGSPSHPSGLENERVTRVAPAQYDRISMEGPRMPYITQQEKEVPPEFSRPPETCPETERPPPTPRPTGKYIAPHLRNNHQQNSAKAPLRADRSLPVLVSDSSRQKARSESLDSEESASSPASHYGAGDEAFEMVLDEPEVKVAPKKEVRQEHRPNPFTLGGCADPRVVVGSILDPMFKTRSASKLGQIHTEDYGGFGGGNQSAPHEESSTDASLQWEIGAVSKCGVRDSNEDAYLVASNLTRGFESLRSGSVNIPAWAESGSHHSGLFCIFDGHNGNHVARFAAEKLPHFLLQESIKESRSDDKGSGSHAQVIEEILRNAIGNLDESFCNLCTEDGRDWESGATAMVALVVDEHLVLANLGDCRAILSRSFDESNAATLKLHDEDGWTKLDLEAGEEVPMAFSCFYREVSHVHSPSRPDERERIQKANGWVTTETEIPIGQLQRMDFCDEDVVGILKRHYLDRYSSSRGESSSSAPQKMIEISRVCGDLAVSRALGDHDYKSAYNTSFENATDELLSEWHSPMLFLPFPDDHNGRFRGDLVSPIPELQRIQLAVSGVFDEFLLLACDGLWDVMDPDDAIRVTRGLLYEKKWEAKRAAARLAELAIHLGSSDNVTVILVRFFKETKI